jgi:hypothetical protein
MSLQSSDFVDPRLLLVEDYQRAAEDLGEGRGTVARFGPTSWRTIGTELNGSLGDHASIVATFEIGPGGEPR